MFIAAIVVHHAFDHPFVFDFVVEVGSEYLLLESAEATVEDEVVKSLIVGWHVLDYDQVL